ncbi:hypothetical protein [Bradyrhizobium iriomotense]|uniref:hypothetical protein n=1 Tax=Bradyrhizobium iriomotense TaxID=441950 RepID=UPI001B89E2BE|nr:hypothetical protein [Bradyrhizobium iriomotense]MBR0781510.1 hypothetical protein [Bradyrhizobium iriomotense]
MELLLSKTLTVTRRTSGAPERSGYYLRGTAETFSSCGDFGGGFLILVIPGRPKGEPGIHLAARSEEKWIPGSR